MFVFVGRLIRFGASRLKRNDKKIGAQFNWI